MKCLKYMAIACGLVLAGMVFTALFVVTTGALDELVFRPLLGQPAGPLVAIATVMFGLAALVGAGLCLVERWE